MPEPTLPASVCLTCKGEGSVEGEFCYPCLGTGFRASIAENIFLKQLADTIDDIKTATVLATGVFRIDAVFDCIDLGEYALLSDADKASLHALLSMATLHIAEGTNAYIVLDGLFPSGNTRNALTALIA